MTPAAVLTSDPLPPLDARTLERVRVLIFEASGIVLGDSKASMVRARLSKRLTATGYPHIDAYLDFVERTDDGTERGNLVSAMTTNVTHFFRESHHFDHLRQIALAPRNGQRLHIWSAGCSSGQEPYSIAMTLADAGIGRSDARILATDIDRQILGRASEAAYAIRDVETVPAVHRSRGIVVSGGEARIAPAIRDMVEFKMLNLIGAWPFRARFDVIFCRNVAIYFDPPTQETLWSRMIQVLQPGGCLFVGHSERLPESLLSQVRYAGQTTYIKTETFEGGTQR